MTNYRCVYSGEVLDRSCEVESCTFNIPGTPLGKTYRRCLLNYLDSLRHNPFGLKNHVDDFSKLSFTQRTQIVSGFFGVSEREVRRVMSRFYSTLFRLMVRDVLVDLPKIKLDPVPYQQCCVCGVECSNLFYPKSGALPAGFGYCRWSCWQLKPPPFIELELSLDVDALDLMKNLEFQSTHSRPQFLRQLVLWILGDIFMC